MTTLFQYWCVLIHSKVMLMKTVANEMGILLSSLFPSKQIFCCHMNNQYTRCF